jgi:hypothetical protein
MFWLETDKFGRLALLAWVRKDISTFPKSSTLTVLRDMNGPPFYEFVFKFKLYWSESRINSHCHFSKGYLESSAQLVIRYFKL